MNRILLCCMVTLLMTGCKTVETPPKPITECSEEIEMEWQDTRWGGHLTTDIASVKLELSYPENVNGFTYTCNGQTVLLQYGELCTEYPMDTFPRESIFQLLYEAFAACRRQGFLSDGERSADGWTFCSTPDGALRVETDEDGNILLLENKGIALTVRFLQTAS